MPPLPIPRARHHVYRGPVRAVVLDWAGTVVDYGCLGPVSVFVDVFANFGVEVSVSEARRFMGLTKKDHVRRMCEVREIAERWARRHGKPPGEADVDALYAQTEPMMVETIRRHADLIPGAIDAVARFREAGVRIGSSTGYTRPIMDVLAPLAAKEGYRPDAMRCPSDVPAGRPYPWMCYRNAIDLEVYPMEALVKIGDTVSDIQEGLNAGMWTIGLTQTGNELGLSLAEVGALPAGERTSRLAAIADRFREAGAHCTAPGLGDCPDLLHQINQRLATGERP